jgi:hypothetical protein
MKNLFYILGFFFFLLDNRLYYPRLFKGNFIKRFKLALNNVNKMNCNYKNSFNISLKDIVVNSKIFSMSINDSRTIIRMHLHNFIINDLKEDTPYRVCLLHKGNFITIENKIIDLGSLYIEKIDSTIDNIIYKAYIIRKINDDLWIFLYCLNFLTGIDEIKICFYTL